LLHHLYSNTKSNDKDSEIPKNRLSARVMRDDLKSIKETDEKQEIVKKEKSDLAASWMVGRRVEEGHANVNSLVEI
jgi:hypothetical protein